MAGSARVCRARPPLYNLLLTVLGIVTLQFVRLRASRMAPIGARRRAPEKKPRDTSTNCRSYRARTEPVFKNERSVYQS